jgi:hypothetical protein
MSGQSFEVVGLLDLLEPERWTRKIWDDRESAE